MVLESHNLTFVNQISDILRVLQDCDSLRDKSKEVISLSINLYIIDVDHMTPHYNSTKSQVKAYFQHLHELLDSKESEILEEVY